MDFILIGCASNTRRSIIIQTNWAALTCCYQVLLLVLEYSSPTLTFAAHNKRLTGQYLYHLRQLLIITPNQLKLHGYSSMSSLSAAWTIVTAFLDSRLLFNFHLYNRYKHHCKLVCHQLPSPTSITSQTIERAKLATILIQTYPPNMPSRL